MENAITTELKVTRWMERCAVGVIASVTAAFIFTVIAPYFGLTPKGEVSSISQQQTIVQNVFISIVSFLIGASVGTRKKDDTIQTLSTTAATAQNALTPPNMTTTTTVTSAPPATVTVKADQPQESKEENAQTTVKTETQ